MMASKRPGSAEADEQAQSDFNEGQQKRGRFDTNPDDSDSNSQDYLEVVKVINKPTLTYSLDGALKPPTEKPPVTESRIFNLNPVSSAGAPQPVPNRPIAVVLPRLRATVAKVMPATSSTSMPVIDPTMSDNNSSDEFDLPSPPYQPVTPEYSRSRDSEEVILDSSDESRESSPAL